MEGHAERLAKDASMDIGRISQPEMGFVLWTFDWCTRKLDNAILRSPPAMEAVERGGDVRHSSFVIHHSEIKQQ